MRRVICKSGTRGYRCKLHRNYSSLEHFKSYDELWGLAKRLGYKSAENAWKANPMIEGSVNPMDFRRVRSKN